MIAIEQTPHTESGLAFENTCGRRGCGHIFKCGGTNPFQDLAVLVARHSPHCIGRMISATHECETGWEPSEAMLDLFLEPENDCTTYLALPDCDATSFPDSYTGSEASVDDLYASDKEMMVDTSNFERAVTAESMSAPSKRRGRASDAYVQAAHAAVEDRVVEHSVAPNSARITVPSKRRSKAADPDVSTTDMVVDIHHVPLSDGGGIISSAPTKRHERAISASTKSKPCRKAILAPVPTAATAPPALTRKKKGARTEAQRRAVLMNDPWTLRVGPQSVFCRGCKNTIRLDARSRYYPGLWEKHRLRCEGVKKGLAESESGSSRSASEC